MFNNFIMTLIILILLSLTKGDYTQKRFVLRENKFDVESNFKVKDTVNYFESKYNNNLYKISYYNMKISININDVDIVNFPYSSPNEVILPCNGILLKRNKEVVIKNIFITENYLYLPVNDFNQRINLFIIDLNTRKIVTIKQDYENFLTTNLSWFIFDMKKNKILTFDSPDLDGRIVMHTYNMINFKDEKSRRINLRAETFVDENKLIDFIKNW